MRRWLALSLLIAQPGCASLVGIDEFTAVGVCGATSESDGTECSIGADPGTCLAGACRVCTDGATRCKPDVTDLVQTCAGGAWVAGTTCSAGASCASGTCVSSDCTSISWASGAVPGGWAVTYPRAWTLEGWFLVSSLPATWGALVGLDAIEACPSMPWGAHWVVYVEGGLVKASLGASFGASPSAAAVKTGVWQHFALQVHGPGLGGSLYVDGALAQTFASGTASWSPACPVRLGNSQGSEPHYLGASMASLRFSSTVRYKGSFTPVVLLPADGSTLARFGFDEMTGTFAKSSVSPETLALSGASWSAKGPGCP